MSIGEYVELVYYEFDGEGLTPVERLLGMANAFSEFADFWNEHGMDYINKEVKYQKGENPDFSKLELYKFKAWLIDKCLNEYYTGGVDIVDTIREFEPLILKEFEDSVIFPNLLCAIGVMDSVSELAKYVRFYYDIELYRYPTAKSPMSSKDVAKMERLKRFELSEKYPEFVNLKTSYNSAVGEPELKSYEYFFESMDDFLIKVERNRFAEKLRDAVYAIKGYCKLEVGSKKYAEIKAKIAKRKRGRKRDPKVRRRNKEIAKYRVNNPRLSWKEIGDEFDVSEDIARKACNNPDN